MASLDLSGFVHAAKDGRDEIDFAVQGVTCAACIGKIERAVKALPGAPDARLNFATRRLKVQWNSGAFDPAAVAAKLEPLGYYARPFDQGALDSDDAAEAKRLLRCLAAAGSRSSPARSRRSWRARRTWTCRFRSASCWRWRSR